MQLSSELRRLLPDMFALYLKTKNCQSQISAGAYRDYQLLMDEHADQIFAMTDDVKQRTGRTSGTARRSTRDSSRGTEPGEDDDDADDAEQMLVELYLDTMSLTRSLRDARQTCGRNQHLASLIRGWIEQSERRAAFLCDIIHAR